MPTSLRCLSADRLPPGGSSHVTHSGDFPLIAVSQSVSQSVRHVQASQRTAGAIYFLFFAVNCF